MCNLYSLRYDYFALPIVIHFTFSNVKFLVPARFLKKGFRSDYF